MGICISAMVADVGSGAGESAPGEVAGSAGPFGARSSLEVQAAASLKNGGVPEGVLYVRRPRVSIRESYRTWNVARHLTLVTIIKTTRSAGRHRVQVA